MPSRSRRLPQVLNGQWEQAEASLTHAFDLCDRNHHHNCSTILSYLVPIQMLRGLLPRQAALDTYGLQYYAPAVAALRAGDTVALRAALDAERLRYIRVRPPVRECDCCMRMAPLHL